MANRLQFRRGTAATATSTNPVLAEGEIGVETDTLKMKMGDGTSAWNSLDYLAKDIVWLGTFSTAPSSPKTNEAYYDSVLGEARIWDGNSWEMMVQDGPQGPQGEPGVGTGGYGIPLGGTVGQILTKTSSTDADASWLTQKLYASKTVNIPAGSTSAQIQALIDAEPEDLNGCTLTFQFGDGTYNITSNINFNYFFGGQIIVQGNPTENTLSGTKSVILNLSTGIAINFYRNNSLIIQYLKIQGTSHGATNMLYLEGNTQAYVRWCSFLGSTSARGIVTSVSPVVLSSYNYFDTFDIPVYVGSSFGRSHGGAHYNCTRIYNDSGWLQFSDSPTPTTYDSFNNGIIVWNGYFNNSDFTFANPKGFLRPDVNNFFNTDRAAIYTRFTGKSGEKIGDGSTGDSVNFPIEIYAPDNTNDAAMQFHISGVFATAFGLGQDGNFYQGGWSDGVSTKYKFYTEKTGVPSMPVGAIYFQLYNEATPTTLFGGTWSNVSSTWAGLFFRAEGGAASAWGTASQGFQNKSHNHQYYYTSASSTYNIQTADSGASYFGAFSYDSSGAALAVTGGSPPSLYASYYTAAEAGIGSSEARPVNQTIRIWKRTA